MSDSTNPQREAAFLLAVMAGIAGIGAYLAQVNHVAVIANIVSRGDAADRSHQQDYNHDHGREMDRRIALHLPRARGPCLDRKPADWEPGPD